MFCQHCGAELPAQALFCRGCGARQEKTAATETGETGGARQELLTALEGVRETALRCEPYYRQYNQLEAEIARWNVYRPTHRGWRALFFIGMPFAILLLPVMLIFLIAGFAGIAEGYPEGMIGGFFLSGLCFLFIAGWFAGSLLLRHAGRKKQRRELEAAQEQIRQRQTEQLRIAGQLDELYRASGLEDVFPQQYLYISAVEACMTLVKNHRADSVKECINLYEQDLHQMRMERSLREQYGTLLAAQAAQQRTAKAAAFAAVMSGIRVISSLRN